MSPLSLSAPARMIEPLHAMPVCLPLCKLPAGIQSGTHSATKTKTETERPMKTSMMRRHNEAGQPPRRNKVQVRRNTKLLLHQPRHVHRRGRTFLR